MRLDETTSASSSRKASTSVTPKPWRLAGGHQEGRAAFAALAEMEIEAGDDMRWRRASRRGSARRTRRPSAAKSRASNGIFDHRRRSRAPRAAAPSSAPASGGRAACRGGTRCADAARRSAPAPGTPRPAAISSAPVPEPPGGRDGRRRNCRSPRRAAQAVRQRFLSLDCDDGTVIRSRLRLRPVSPWWRRAAPCPSR